MQIFVEHLSSHRSDLPTTETQLPRAQEYLSPNVATNGSVETLMGNEKCHQHIAANPQEQGTKGGNTHGVGEYLQ